MKTIPSKEFLDTMSKDPGNWKGIFYVNKKDPRLMVPKLSQNLGWTLNFANPIAYIGMGALILIIVACEFFL